MPRLSFDLMENILPSEERPSEIEEGKVNQQKERVKKIIRRVIAEQLTERQRELCTLYFYEEMDMPTIAELLSINKSTVSRTIGRALKNINDKVRYLKPR